MAARKAAEPAYQPRQSQVLNCVPVNGASGSPGKETASEPVQLLTPAAFRSREPVPLNGAGGLMVAKPRALSVLKVAGAPDAKALR